MKSFKRIRDKFSSDVRLEYGIAVSALIALPALVVYRVGVASVTPSSLSRRCSACAIS
jgi:hypothetical protein